MLPTVRAGAAAGHAAHPHNLPAVAQQRLRRSGTAAQPRPLPFDNGRAGRGWRQHGWQHGWQRGSAIVVGGCGAGEEREVRANREAQALRRYVLMSASSVRGDMRKDMRLRKPRTCRACGGFQPEGHWRQCPARGVGAQVAAAAVGAAIEAAAVEETIAV